MITQAHDTIESLTAAVAQAWADLGAARTLAERIFHAARHRELSQRLTILQNKSKEFNTPV